MGLSLDQHLGVHAQALTVRAKRAEVIAENLANADTPGYRARDLDFRAALAAAGTADTLRTTHAAHVVAPTADAATEAGSGIALDAALRYRTPLAPSLDGNTVDAQVEQAAFAENAVRYQATLTFLSSKFRGLMTALTGQ
jgi:flagellar basal-body rod protein FlgB